MEGMGSGKESARAKDVVCIHWLQNRCWHEDSCPYLHSYEGAKLPLCPALARRGFCPYVLCPCRHPQSEKPCPRYQLGFCKFGPACTLAHVPSQARVSSELPDWYLNQMMAIFSLSGAVSREDSPSEGSISTVSSRALAWVVVDAGRDWGRKESFRLKDERMRKLLTELSLANDKILLLFVSLGRKEAYGIGEVTRVASESNRCHFNWVKRCRCEVQGDFREGALEVPEGERLQSYLQKQEDCRPGKRHRGGDYAGYYEYQALCRKTTNTAK